MCSLVFVVVFFQIRGIGELLEGLIPYSQRHFGRIDRLERSTFLLDYTLTGMSVVEPETVPIDLVKDIKLSSGLEEQLPEAVVHDGEQEYDEPKEKTGVKRRKSRKSRDVAYKKVKGLNGASDLAIPSQG